MLYGPQWAGIERGLQLYWLYVYTMGINGITEAYVNGVIQLHQIVYQQSIQVLVTILYLTLLVMGAA